MMTVSTHDVKKNIRRWALQFSIGSQRRRAAIKNKDFTIVSNDCWGAEVYKDLGIPFQTPFIGTFLAAPCFMRLIQDCERIVKAPLTFVESSRYPYVNELKAAHPFPTGLLDGQVEIQFMHFASQEEAAQKWARRVERSNFDRLFFKLSADKDLFTTSDLQAFDALPTHRKVAFSSEKHPGLKSVVEIPDYTIDGQLMYLITLKHFDIVRWLNS